MAFLFSFVASQMVYGQWVQRQSFPVHTYARNHPVTFAIDSFGYMATGYNRLRTQKTPTMNDVLRYDPAKDTWKKMSDFPGPRRGLGYGLSYGGKGYMGFGIEVDSSGWRMLADLWEYNPKTDSWKELAPCPCEARTHPAFLEVEGLYT